jgi:hypothetical protein
LKIFSSQVRLICLTRISFLEDSVGESLTRMLLIGTTVTVSVAVCVLELCSQDLNTGTPMAFITHKSVNAGLQASPF